MQTTGGIEPSGRIEPPLFQGSLSAWVRETHSPEVVGASAIGRAFTSVTWKFSEAFVSWVVVLERLVLWVA